MLFGSVEPSFDSHECKPMFTAPSFSFAFSFHCLLFSRSLRSFFIYNHRPNAYSRAAGAAGPEAEPPAGSGVEDGTPGCGSG